MHHELYEEYIWDEKHGIPVIRNKKPLVTAKTVESHPSPPRYKVLKLASNDFEPNGMIPSKFTCDGHNINPSFEISNIPASARSMAIIVDDPEGFKGTQCHWVIWNLPVTDRIGEGEHRGLPGRNDFGYFRYNGPCPPVGTHRYYFKVYALDCVLDIPASSGKKELEAAMNDHVVGFGFLMGRYHMRL